MSEEIRREDDKPPSSLQIVRKETLYGWKHVGYCGSCFIYAMGNKRRLVDPKAGKSTFEYIIQVVK